MIVDLSSWFLVKIRLDEYRGICGWGTKAFNTCRKSVFDMQLWE